MELVIDHAIKPPFRLPKMVDIHAIPWNGYHVVSTFSGCGGSCLGYRMAGFRVLWANEFVPMARRSYRANHPRSILDGRDIKRIEARDILYATGLKKGELDLFDGSPPCQAFSCAGNREKSWGKKKTYEHGTAQKNEELFYEYIRLLGGLAPKVFVAENVVGLVKGVAKGFFIEIMRALKASGYRVVCRQLDAQWLGVPQTRNRAIFVGVRNDLETAPAHPKPLPYRYSMNDALPHIKNLKYNCYDGTRIKETKDQGPCPAIKANGGIGPARGKQWYVEADEPALVHISGFQKGKIRSLDDPGPCVMAGAGLGGSGQSQVLIQQGRQRRHFTIDEIKRLCSFPDDFVLIGSKAQQWERLGNSVPPVMMSHIAGTIRDQILDKLKPHERVNQPSRIRAP